MVYAVRTILTSLLITGVPLSARAEVRCPALPDNHPYAKASVFDGPPEEQADLVPDSQTRGTNMWQIAPIFGLG